MKKISRRSNAKSSATTKSTNQSRAEGPEEARALDIQRLGKVGVKDRKARDLTRRIESCTTEHPCWSGACPRCMTATQSGLARSLRRLVHSSTEGGKFVVLTIAPTSSVTTVSQLPTFDNYNFRRRLKYALRNAPINWAVFGTDFSFNEHAAGRYKPFVMPHVHGLVATPDIKALRLALRQAFPPSDAIPRPTKLTEWDGQDAALHYMFKRTFERRIGIDDVERVDRKTGEIRECRATQKERLRNHERVPLMLLLDRITLEGRLTFVKTQLRRTSNGLTIMRQVS